MTTPTQATYQPIPQPNPALTKQQPAPPPPPPPPSNMTTAAQPPPPVVTTTWTYAPPPPQPSATVYAQQPPPPPPPPQTIPVHAVQPHYTSTIYAPHPSTITHAPQTAGGIPTGHHIAGPEYMHTPHASNTTAAPVSVATTIPNSAPATHAPTAYCQQRIHQLEEELALAKREIERLMNRLGQLETEKTTKDIPTSGTSTPQKTQTRYWTQEEHMRFLEALGKYGPKDVRSIAAYVGSRNATQVRTHAQKYFLRVQRQAAQRAGGQNTRKRSMSESDLTKMGARAKTPPDSPRVDDVGKELGAAATAGVMGGRVMKKGMRKLGSPTNSGGKPPAAGVPASCGINLLSIVASERKDAMNRSAAAAAASLPPKAVKVKDEKDTDMADAR